MGGIKYRFLKNNSRQYNKNITEKVFFKKINKINSGFKSVQIYRQVALN